MKVGKTESIFVMVGLQKKTEYIVEIFCRNSSTKYKEHQLPNWYLFSVERLHIFNVHS